MKKINFWLLVICLGFFCSSSMNAQITIYDSDSIQFEPTIDTGAESTLHDEAAAQINTNETPWSPGGKHLVNFCETEGYDGDYVSAIAAYIDQDGYYYQVSDETYKENITTLNASLSKIVKLRGVEYNHKNKSDASNSSNKATRANAQRYGFLAQEVENIIPDAVETGSTGKKYINYQAMIPLLVEALKEQQSKIDKQDEQIKILENQISIIQKSVKLN